MEQSCVSMTADTWSRRFVRHINKISLPHRAAHRAAYLPPALASWLSLCNSLFVFFFLTSNLLCQNLRFLYKDSWERWVSARSILPCPLQTAVDGYRSALRVCDLVISKKKSVDSWCGCGQRTDFSLCRHGSGIIGGCWLDFCPAHTGNFSHPDTKVFLVNCGNLNALHDVC